MKKTQKLLGVTMTVAALLGMATVGGCSAPLTGVSIDGDKGYVAVPRHVFGISLSPQIFSCEAGSCTKAK